MNAFSGPQVQSSFAQGILSLLDRVEYRRVTSQEDLHQIGGLRQISYENKEFINSSEFGSFVDDYDSDPDCYVLGVYIDEVIVSTVRLHVATSEHLHGPTASYFPKRAISLTQNGGCYVDPSRFAADPAKLWQYPAIPFLTLRTAALASEFFKADHCMTFVRSDVASFYRRSFGAVDFEPPQPIKGFSVPMMLLGARIEDIRQRIETRYPFFKSTENERRLMFERADRLFFPSLNIMPTARYAMARSNPYYGAIPATL